MNLIPAQINISTVFKTVIDINEQDHIIELKFAISLKWYELRASYSNLKTNQALNVLKQREIQQIWYPYVIFDVSRSKIWYWFYPFFVIQNTDSNEAITIEDVDSIFVVTREGDFIRTGKLQQVDQEKLLPINL